MIDGADTLVPTRVELLAQLDRLHHRQRVRHVSLLGRDAAGSSALMELLDELSGGDTYERSLALRMAAAAGDSDRIEAGLGDPSRTVRVLAMRLAPRFTISDEMLVRRLLEASVDERRALSRLVRRTGRAQLADRLIHDVQAQRGDDDAARLMVAGSPAIVARWLADLDHAVVNWGPLARRHPALVADHLARRLTAAPRHQRLQVWARFGGALAALAEREPTRLLELAGAYGPSDALPPGVDRLVPRLARGHPDAVASLLLRPAHVVSLRQRRLPATRPMKGHAYLRHFSPGHRVALARALAPVPHVLVDLVAGLAPSERPDLLRLAYEGIEPATRVWPGFREVLPASAAQDECRRLLALHFYGESHERALLLKGYMPIGEVREELEAEAGRSDPDLRARGLSLLAASTVHSRDPSEFARTLKFLQKLANERDNVRLAALGPLLRVPPVMLTQENLVLLRSLLLAVADARDARVKTWTTVERIAWRLVAHPGPAPDAQRQLGVEVLGLVAGRTGGLHKSRHPLPTGVEHELFAQLQPHLDAAAEADRHGLVVNLVSVLGRRSRGVDGLQTLLGRATTAPDDAVARRAIELWLQGPEVDERLGRLLVEQPSSIYLPVVLTTVHRRRQDLLETLLAGNPIAGRFRSERLLTESGAHVPPVLAGLGRWLPRQRRAYARLLENLVSEPTQSIENRRLAIASLARLADVGAAVVIGLTEHADVPVAEAAISAIGRTDRPQDGVTTLLGLSGGDRARVAVPALATCARFITPAELGPMIDSLLGRSDIRLQTRKEAVRMLSRHRPPGVAHRLATELDRRPLHRGVALALGQAALGVLDEPVAWRILEYLSTAGRDEAGGLLRIRRDSIPTRHRSRLALLVISVTDHADASVRQQAFRVATPWAMDGHGDTLAARSAAVITDMANHDDWFGGVSALVALARGGDAGNALVEVVAALASTPVPDVDEAGAERDRPAYLRLASLISGVLNLATEDRVRIRWTLVAMAEVLVAHPTAIVLEYQLRLLALDWSSPAPAGDALVAMAGRLAGRPGISHQVLLSILAGLERDAGTWPDAAKLAEIADRLAVESPPAGPMLALGVVTAAGRRTAWRPEWRDRLRRLRQHPDPDVATLASWVFTAPPQMTSSRPGPWTIGPAL